MAKGRPGMFLEGWKFAVYMAIPLGASWYFNDPARQRDSADYWQYMKYPANPNTNMKEQIEELRQKQTQRTVYQEQMRELQKQAQRSREAADSDDDDQEKRGWLRWIGLGKSQNKE
jgi:hypothetical protein